jgi:hypothetical protein
MNITVRPLRRPMANASAAVPCSQSGARETTGCDGMLSGHVGSVQAGPLIGGLQCWLRPADSQRTGTSGDHQLT